MLDLLKAFPQVEAMAQALAGPHICDGCGKAYELGELTGVDWDDHKAVYRRYLCPQCVGKPDDDAQRSAALEAFKSKYGVVFSRETFTLDRPTADNTFVLQPDNEDLLPPIGAHIRVNGYRGEVWHTVVIDADPSHYSYTAQIVEAG